MPSIQTVLPPVIGPSGPQSVRANPHMFDAEAQAKENLGASVQGVGDLVFRIKHATDNAYLIQANTKLQAAHQDFKTWTQTQPDTTQWNEEFEARTKAAREEVDAGATNLSQMAKLRLRTEADSWQARAAADTRSMASSQNIHNALGIAQEGVTAAIGANDSETAHAIIDTSVRDGVMHANVGAALKKRVDIGIATNLANSDASNDPFTFIEKLNETDEDGSPKNYKGLPPASRATMQFRASKLANETRTQTMRDWTQAIYDAQQQGAPMPDKDSILTEAKRQGISPKWVEKAFAPPKAAFDEEEYAASINHISGLNLVDDPTGENMAHAVAIATKFKGYAGEHLQQLIKTYSDDGSKAKKPVMQRGLDIISKNLASGVYGALTERTKVGEDELGKDIFKTQPAKTYQSAQMKAADMRTNLLKWAEDPDTGPITDEKVSAFIFNQQKGALTGSLRAIRTGNPVGGVSVAPSSQDAAKSKAEAAAALLEKFGKNK